MTQPTVFDAFIKEAGKNIRAALEDLASDFNGPEEAEPEENVAPVAEPVADKRPYAEALRVLAEIEDSFDEDTHPNTRLSVVDRYIEIGDRLGC